MFLSEFSMSNKKNQFEECSDLTTYRSLARWLYGTFIILAGSLGNRFKGCVLFLDL